MMMDWHQPWTWPMAYQYVLRAGAVWGGVLLLSPWWLTSWQAWDAARAAQEQQRTQQQAGHDLRTQTEQWKQTSKQTTPIFADAAVLTTLAHQQGLQLSHLAVEPVQNPAWKALQMQQLSVHMKVQGSWDAWRHWLMQWPTSAPGVTLSSLTLKAAPQGGILADLSVVAPQTLMSDFVQASPSSNSAVQADPFNAQSWVNTQRAYAAQHPSYERLVVPELLRPREALENFARERLQYVGQIAVGADVYALVEVLPMAGAKTNDVSMMRVYRVRVNGYLGQHFGRLLAIADDHLMVQEVVLLPTGEWQTREVRLPLHEASS